MEKLCEDLLPQNKLEVTNEVLPGKVRIELMRFIRNNQFDLVIMGVNGDGSSNETGSNTNHLIEKATIPILVIPNNYRLNE